MGTRDYSTTAASNLTVQGIGIQEGMARSSVNNAMRGQLADIADLLLDLGGATITTGSANAYLLALDTTPTALSDNLFFLATSHASNTGASTLNVNGLGVKAIEKLAGGTAVPIGAQDFPAGHVGIFTYSSTNNSFLMLNPATALAVGAESASFETRTTAAAAATAGTIPSSLDIIEVLGHTSGGDDVVVPYTRELAAPAVGDSFADLDGTFWAERAQGLHRVDGVAALRTYVPIAGRSVYLAYHTTVGDLGGGIFRGVRDDPPGTHVDNDGTIIVPTGGGGSSAWLRVWDHMTAHVGWFGAKCTPRDPSSDDYIPVKKCFDLFTDGGRIARGASGTDDADAIYSGVVDVGPGFRFSQPLIYGGAVASSFKLAGNQSLARGGFEKSLLHYSGPETFAALIFYGANEWIIEDINFYPGLALSSVLVTADNTYNNYYVHTTSAPITAGANRVVSPLGGPAAADRILWLQPGVFLGIDEGANFEIVYITAVDATAGTFTATFAKNHATGVLLGGGHPSSSGWVNRCQLQCPVSPIWTTLTADALGTGAKTFQVADITGITVGRSIRVGSLTYAEILYPTSVNVGAGTFTAVSNYDHLDGSLVMYPTSGIAVGNRLLGTVQVDNISFNDCFFMGASATTYPGTGIYTVSCYAGFRQIWGGNVKAFFFNRVFVTSLRVGFACEQSSGQYIFNGGSSAGNYEMLWYGITASLTVQAWEDESFAMWLATTGGQGTAQATFIGCTMQGAAPTHVPEASDEMFVFPGQLTFIGCNLQNGRIFSDGVSDGTLPIIVSTGVYADIGIFPSGLTLLNNSIVNATLANFHNILRRSSGDATNILESGPGNVTMLNNIGSVPGANARLPNFLPAQRMWESTIVKDPVSLNAGELTAIFVTGIPGAALGDLVEASFTVDLQGIALHAWVSTTDVVSYQFSNPTAGTIDLGSGTVKCRVKK